MNKNYILFSSLICCGLLLSSLNNSKFEFLTYHKSPFNAGGSPPGKTGAPGENNCTGCHAGSTLDGTSENVLVVSTGGNVVTDYIPGATHQISLTMSSNPSKKGFQAIVLDSNNDMMGDFTAGNGTSISSQGSKKYANHNSSSNSNATTTWTWDWVAPSSAVGPATFYVASNSANGNGNTSGDAIYLSQHTLGAPFGEIEDHQLISNFNVNYSPFNKMLNFSFGAFKNGNLSLNIVDLNGKSVYSSNVGLSSVGQNELKVSIDKSLKPGIYVINMFLDNIPSSKKIFIN